MVSAFRSVFLRELRAYFQSPLAYVFLAVYLVITGLATWNVSRFFDTALASLTPLFQFQPWLLAIFIPAIGMRLWSEDFRSRTADLYFTSQRPLWLIHLAKFAAGLTVILVALAVTCPYWFAVNYLGSPDNQVIGLSYLALFGLSAIFLLITLVFSALTQQQVIAFVLSVVTAFAILTLGLPDVTGQFSAFLPELVVVWLQNISLLDAYFRAVRGVWILSDLIFLGLLGACLFSLGVIILSARRRIGQTFATPWLTLFCLTLFVGLPIAREQVSVLTASLRFDMTENRLHTLSPAARTLVRNLKEPVTLDFYYNEAVGREYPEIRAHADRVTALLDAFVRGSGGRLILNTIDPEPFSEAEDRAITDGIDAVTTEGVDPLYFGLTGTNLIDQSQTISFLNPELDAALEFELASLISRLDRPERPRIAILSGISAFAPKGGDGRSNRLLTTLDTGYQIEWLTGTSFDIPEGIETLVMIAPDELTEYTAYQIDQFLLRKGRVILLTDPAPLLSGATDPPEALTRLINHWGVTAPDSVLADMDIGLPVTTSGPAGDRIEPQPLYPGPGPDQFDQTDFLVAGLQQKIYFGGSGWFEPKPQDNLTFRPLIRSGRSPAYIPVADLDETDLSPGGVRRQSLPLEREVAIALRVSGRFQTAFPEGAPAPTLPDDPVLRRLAEAELVERPHLNAGKDAGEIVLIADTDFLLDAFYVHPQTGQPIAGNEDFLVSLLDQFAGQPELAALRARPLARRPMTRVLSMRADAEALYLETQDRIESDIARLEGEIGDSPDAASNDLRSEYLKARENLRTLQKAFRSSLEQLEMVLRILTIWLPVALIILIGLGIQMIGRRSS